MSSTGICILPVGPVPGRVMERLRESLRETFGREILIMQEMPLPARCEDKERGQWNSTKMLGGIASAGGMVLGVAEVDLYAPGLNFVFGEADPERGVCVISLARLREEFRGRAPDEGLFLDRAVKEAVHELGHLHGLRHCPDRRCVMHFSNTLLDTDVKGSMFCGRCGRLIRSN